MKNLTFNLNKTMIVIVSVLLLNQAALAGLSTRSEVVVVSTAASGSKKAARISGDSLQYIGCNVGVSNSATGDYMSCYARNKSGATFYCYSLGTAAANFIAALKSATDYSYLSISKYSNGTCKTLKVDNSSRFL